MVWCWESRSSRKQKKNWRSKSTSRKSTNQTSREPTNQTSRKSINQTSRKSINQTNRESKRYLNRWFDICMWESEIYAEVKGLELLIIWSDHLNYSHKIYAFPVKLFLKLPLFLHPLARIPPNSSSSSARHKKAGSAGRGSAPEGPIDGAAKF